MYTAVMMKAQTEAEKSGMLARRNTRLLGLMAVFAATVVGVFLWDMANRNAQPLPAGLSDALQGARVLILHRLEVYPSKDVAEVVDLAIHQGDGSAWKKWRFSFNPNRDEWTRSLHGNTGGQEIVLVFCRPYGETVAACDGEGVVRRLTWGQAGTEIEWRDHGVKVE